MNFTLPIEFEPVIRDPATTIRSPADSRLWFAFVFLSCGERL
jgi:hypothetical protein